MHAHAHTQTMKGTHMRKTITRIRTDKRTHTHCLSLSVSYMAACLLSHCWHARPSWMYCSTSHSMVRL